jgi:hypothetical protein
MGVPTSCREVYLIDGRTTGRDAIAAQLYRDYPTAALEDVEAKWSSAREQASFAGHGTGLAPIEHAHWDWRNKTDSVEAGEHLLIAVECEAEPQGLMAVPRTPRPALTSPRHLVYVDYLESAPWNLRAFTPTPRFLGVGTVLLAESVRLSIEMGLEGRIGLHSLPQAEPFYAKCGMTRVGVDPNYFELPYYEFAEAQAAYWLTKIGALT